MKITDMLVEKALDKGVTKATVLELGKLSLNMDTERILIYTNTY